MEVAALLPPYGFQGFNSDYQAWQQVPLPTAPHLQPVKLIWNGQTSQKTLTVKDTVDDLNSYLIDSYKCSYSDIFYPDCFTDKLQGSYRKTEY